MSEPVVLSGSSISTFLKCQRQWERQYIYRDPRPPSLVLSLGTAAHEAAELDLVRRMETGELASTEEVVQVFRDSFERETVDAEDEPKETKGEATDSGVKAVTFWHDNVAPPIKPKAVELHGQFAIEGIPYDWTADLIEEGPEEGEWGLDDDMVTDHKFVSKTPSDDGEKYLVNMVGYAIGYRHQTGNNPKRRLSYTVRLKRTPKHVVVDKPALTDADVDKFVDVVTSVNDTIQRGSFPPTGAGTWVCGYCPVSKAHCRFSRNP